MSKKHDVAPAFFMLQCYGQSQRMEDKSAAESEWLIRIIIVIGWT